MAKKILSPEAKSAKNVGRAQGAVVALLAAGIGAGVYESYEAAAARLVHVSKKVMPRPEYADVYGRKYQMYRKVIDALSGVWETLNNGGESDV